MNRRQMTKRESAKSITMKSGTNDRPIGNPAETHADLAVCITCESCEGNCHFIEKPVVLKYNNRWFLGVRNIGNSFSSCNARCGKTCITRFSLLDSLRSRNKTGRNK